MSLKQTPSQTVGPFFAFSLTAPQYGYPLNAIASGELADQARLTAAQVAYEGGDFAQASTLSSAVSATLSRFGPRG